MSENLVRILEYSNNETKGAWQSHESRLTQITTVFNWNKISFPGWGDVLDGGFLKQVPVRGGGHTQQATVELDRASKQPTSVC